MNDFQLQLKQKIDDILQKRKKLSHVVKSQAERIASLKRILAELIDQIPIIADQAIDQDLLTMKANLESTRQRIIDQEKDFEMLYRRFDRQTINIGVIGQARQGKSTLLRRLSGLSEQVIPSREGTFCTSAQSIIYHHDHSRTYAKVYFYSESEFLDKVLKDYFLKLNYPLPVSISQFKKQLIPDFKESDYPDPSTSKVTHGRLKEYQERVDSFATFLQEKSHVMEVEAGDIEKYVSYQDGDYPYIAVEKVEIFHQFPAERTAVSSIGWIDMPGLGDTRLGDEERMIKALGEDTDFILLVRRPQKDDDLKNTDNLLSDAAHKALKDRLPLNQWSFMILNYDGMNLRSCDYLKNHKLKNSLYVADFFIVNCDVADQGIEQNGVLNVNQLLELVLQNLAKTIESLDATYVNSFKKSFESIQQDVYLCIKNSRSLYLRFDSHSKFVDYLSVFFQELANKLEKVRQELDLENLATEDPFQEKIQGSVEQCRKELEAYKKDADGLLENEITSYFNQKRSRAGTHDNFIHQIRSNALANFHGIELGLRLSLWEKKDRICCLLRDLNLDALVNPSADNEHFLADFCAIIPVDLGNLKRGFSFLSSFELQYKGFIQTIIWGHITKHMSPLKSVDEMRNPSAKFALIYSFLADLLNDMTIDVIKGKLLSQDQNFLNGMPSSLDVDTLSHLLANTGIQAVLQGIPNVGLSANLIQSLVEPLLNAGIPGVSQDNEGASLYQLDTEVIKSSIFSKYELAINECERALRRLLPTPSEVARSMVGEFIDHILLSKNVSLEWNKLLGKDENRLLMWPELKKIEDKKESIMRWNRLLDNAENINQTLSSFV